MNEKRYRKIAFNQYKYIPKLLEKPWDIDTSLQILNHLIDRDDMNWEDMQKEIEATDKKIAKGFQKADNIWLEKMKEGMTAVQLEDADWWIKIQQFSKGK